MSQPNEKNGMSRRLWTLLAVEAAVAVASWFRLSDDIAVGFVVGCAAAMTILLWPEDTDA